MKKHCVPCLVLFAVLISGSFAARPVLAHAFLDHAEPRVGATVRASPPAVVLTFTEPIEVSFSHVDVQDDHGAQIGGGALEHPAPEQLRLSLPLLPAGTYSVHWAVTSIDTHQTEGKFEFSVTAP